MAVTVILDRVAIAAEMARQLVTNKSIAERAGISRNSVSKAVNGSPVGVKVARGVCDALELEYAAVVRPAGDTVADA